MPARHRAGPWVFYDWQMSFYISKFELACRLARENFTVFLGYLQMSGNNNLTSLIIDADKVDLTVQQYLARFDWRGGIG